MKEKNVLALVAVIGVVVALSILTATGTLFSVTGDQEQDEEQFDWAGRSVPVRFQIEDQYADATVNASAKIYSEQPEDWENMRGNFDDAENYDTASASSADWDDFEYSNEPGTYYAVIDATGYNRKFVEFEIPDLDDVNENSLEEYSSNPVRVTGDRVEMTQVGNVESAPSDISLTFTEANKTDHEISEDKDLTVADNTEFMGYNLIVEDVIEFSYNTDGSGEYDEGVKEFDLTFQGETYEIFDSEAGIDQFEDKGNRFSTSIEGVNVANENDIEMTLDMVADTTNVSGANDELLGEGDGTVATFIVESYDEQGETKTFASFDLTV